MSTESYAKLAGRLASRREAAAATLIAVAARVAVLLDSSLRWCRIWPASTSLIRARNPTSSVAVTNTAPTEFQGS